MLLDGFRPPLLEHGILSEAEYARLRDDVRAEVYDPALRMEAEFRWAWGRRVGVA